MLIFEALRASPASAPSACRALFSASASWSRSARSTAASRRRNDLGRLGVPEADLALGGRRIGARRSPQRSSRARVRGRCASGASSVGARPRRSRSGGAAISARLASSASRARVASAFGLGRIELEQQSPAFTRLAVLDVDGGDLAGIERLDHLGAADRLDLARRDRVHVEPAEERPRQRRGEEGADRQHQRDRQRRRRRLQDLERRGQEFAVAAR